MYLLDNTDKVEIVKDIINNILSTDIEVKSRRRKVLTGRQFYYRWMRDNTDYSYKGLAKTLKLTQDHSTVIGALHEFDNYILFEKDYRDLWHQVEIEIVNKFYQLWKN